LISLIASMDRNRLIGKDNRLPWRIPLDLAYFKKNTLGHTVVMGRKTFESIGKPLPGRSNWIITRDENYIQEGCSVFHSIEEVLKAAPEEELFIIGGAEIYASFFPYADKLYITLIDEIFIGDTFFPQISPTIWEQVSKVKGERNEKNPHDYYFTVYEKAEK
jgi:dihydrofolate reductase